MKHEASLYYVSCSVSRQFKPIPAIKVPLVFERVRLSEKFVHILLIFPKSL